MDARKANLLFGGDSDERLVSVASAQNLAEHHDWQSFFFFSPALEVHEISKSELLSHQNSFKTPFQPHAKATRFEYWLQAQSRGDSVSFLGFHGGDQENGRLQKDLEKYALKYTGSRSEASSLCFDKAKSKLALTAALNGKHLAQSKNLELNGDPQTYQQLKTWLNQTPLVFKPNRSGSSLGLFFVYTEDELALALKKIEQSSIRNYIIENLIEGIEVTVGVIENEHRHLQALPATEVVLATGRQFDYDGKYLGLGTQEITPARITPEQMRRCQDIAIIAHKTLNCFGYSRTDFILTPHGPYFLEINTLPGLTRASFLPQQIQVAGLNMEKFISQQLALASNIRA